MTDPVARLGEAAARAEDIEGLAEAALAFAGGDCDACAVWSRFGSGGWHLLASHGSAPEEPPEEGTAGWQTLRLDTAGRTTIIAGRPALLGPDERDVLRGMVETGLLRLDAMAAAEAASYSGDQRIATVLDAAPDAVLVVSLDGRIIEANGQAVELFGYSLEELIGRDLEDLVPENLRAVHAEHRGQYATAPTPRSMGAGLDLHARRRDGKAIAVDIALTPLEAADEPAVAAFVRDATMRRRGEADRQQVREAELARRQAFELNDNVVQGLTSAIWLLELDDQATALTTLRDTLAEAREMMADLLGLGVAPPGPGELQRTAPTAGTHIEPHPEGAEVGEPGVRVLVVDDSEAIRVMLATRFRLTDGVTVVGEAGDGLAALQAVEEQKPDVVVMDLSMPRMDGLEATAALRERHPDLRVVVLTGHASASMRERALEAGAQAYVEKGSDFNDLVAAVLNNHVAD